MNVESYRVATLARPAMRSLLRFERQPPGTAITRSVLVAGGALAVGAGCARGRSGAAVRGVGRRRLRARCSCSGAIERTTAQAAPPTGCSTTSSIALWDGAVLSGIAWVARDGSASVAVAALAALSLSFVAGYIRARGAALGYSVEERHVTRGARYALVMAVPAVRMDLGGLDGGRDVRPGRARARGAGRAGGAGDVSVRRESAGETATYLLYRFMSWLGPIVPVKTGRSLLRTGGSAVLPARRRDARRRRREPGAGAGASARGSARAGVDPRGVRALRALLVRHVQRPGLGRARRSPRRSGSSGIEHVEKGLAEGKGVVIALPHTGNWDVGGRAMGLAGARSCRSPSTSSRSACSSCSSSIGGSWGWTSSTSSSDHVGRQLTQRLEENRIVALVADRDLSGRRHRGRDVRSRPDGCRPVRR